MLHGVAVLHGVVHPVVQGLAPPKAVGIVELEEIHPWPGVCVAAGVDLMNEAFYWKQYILQ